MTASCCRLFNLALASPDEGQTITTLNVSFLFCLQISRSESSNEINQQGVALNPMEVWNCRVIFLFVLMVMAIIFILLRKRFAERSKTVKQPLCLYGFRQQTKDRSNASTTEKHSLLTETGSRDIVV